MASCHAAHRHVRACRQSIFLKGSDDGSLTTLRQGVRGRMWRRDARAAVRFEYSMKKPAADFSARALKIAAMMALCH
jgi:hypothetical protein